jgi:hypothetical protein
MLVCYTLRRDTGQRTRRNKIGRLHEACQRNTTYGWELRFCSAHILRHTPCIGTPTTPVGQTPATKLPGWMPCESCNASDGAM